MKKFVLGTLIMIAGLFTLAVVARAEIIGVVVDINQDFVAGGKAFPAGTYKVYRTSPETSQTLILQGEESGTSVFLSPSTHDGTFSGQLKVKLTRVGDVYYLSEVVTDLGVYTFAAPHRLTRTADAKHNATVNPSGSN
jgi:hypothetical protein